MTRHPQGVRVPREMAAVWALAAASLAAVLVTYARLPASELYNVSGSGSAAGSVAPSSS